MDVASCVQWIQKTPASNEAELADIEGAFYLSLVDLGSQEGVRKGILDSSPRWLQGHEDKERYLRQRVWLRIYERFEIKVLDPRAGYHLRLR
ncbi:MAG TPA: hypothetical protein VMT20_23640 [Terriglobia bacterium]|nr:hypothetical protein [Terriglobia bacterium]